MKLSDPAFTLTAIRDTRERTVAWEVRSQPMPGTVHSSVDDEVRALIDTLKRTNIFRSSGSRSIYMPLTPGLLKAGVITPLASSNIVFLLSVSSLDDVNTKRLLERYSSGGFRFGFTGEDLHIPLVGSLTGSPFVFELCNRDNLDIASMVQRILENGGKPLARHVDDRFVREKLRSAGVLLFSGRAVSAGRGSATHSRKRLVSFFKVLCELSDGRHPDSKFESYLSSDPEILESVLRSAQTMAPPGIRIKSLSQLVSVLGREALVERSIIASALLFERCTGDTELPTLAIRRAFMMDTLCGSLDRGLHSRTRLLAGIISLADLATGLTPSVLADAIEPSGILRDIMIKRSSLAASLMDLIESHEMGWWDDFFDRCATIGISPSVVCDAWLDGWKEARIETSYSLGSTN